MGEITEVPELRRIATFCGKGWKEYRMSLCKNGDSILSTSVKFVEVLDVSRYNMYMTGNLHLLLLDLKYTNNHIPHIDPIKE